MGLEEEMGRDKDKPEEKKIERPSFDLPEELLHCRDMDRDNTTPPPIFRVPHVNDGLSSSQSSTGRSSVDSTIVSFSPESKNMLRRKNICLVSFFF